MQVAGGFPQVPRAEGLPFLMADVIEPEPALGDEIVGLGPNGQAVVIRLGPFPGGFHRAVEGVYGGIIQLGPGIGVEYLGLFRLFQG